MKSILMVDDEVHILEVAKLSLERLADYSVDVISSPEEALKILNQKHYDVIISDYEMPGMNGASFLKVLKARGDNTPFIILTSRGREEVALECLASGADCYLQRSGSPESWLSVLRSEVDKLGSQSVSETSMCPDNKGAICKELYNILYDDPNIVTRKTMYAQEALSRIHSQDRSDVKSLIQAVAIDKIPRTGLFRLRVAGTWSWQHGLFTSSATDGQILLSTKSIDRNRLTLLDVESVWSSISEVLDHCPFNVDLIDSDLNLLYSNRFKIQGEKCYRAIRGQKCPCKNCGLIESLKTGQEVRRFYNEQGKEMDTRYIPAIDEEGRATSAVRINNEREASPYSDLALETLLNTNHKLHLLTSITRHDVLNQLTAMAGYLELYDTLPEKRETFILRLKELISNSDKQIVFTRDYQKLGITAPYWQDSSDMVKSAAQELAIDPHMVSVEGSLPLIFGDPMLSKVITNIFSNSILHGKTVTRIRVWFKVQKGVGSFFIADNGIGISEDKKERIFDRGFGCNHGYGLFLVRMILDITGITISEIGEEGQGACFRMDLPTKVYTLKNA